MNTKDQWSKLLWDTYLKQDGRCHYCQAQVNFKNWSRDHLIPVCRGGKDHSTNIVGCCKPCNVQKGPRTPEEYRAGVSKAEALRRTWEPLVSALHKDGFRLSERPSPHQPQLSGNSG